MIPFHVTSLTSPPGRTPERQVIALLQSLSALLNASGRDESHILALTLFIDATDAESYGRFKEHLLECFREFFPERLPPVSVVAEPPERRRFVSLEATLLASASVEASVVRKELDGLAYTVIEGPGGRQVHCGGITHPDRDQDIESRSRSSFERMEAVLGAERMTYGHVIRQWNYIETMLDVREDVQCYQVFNDVRTIAYGKSEFPTGYPASTGIGQAAGGVILEFIALDPAAGIAVTPLTNPRQVDAHLYSPEVLVGEAHRALPAKSRPKFERGKRVLGPEDEAIFLSGTAAILGEESVGGESVEAQTLTTIENIEAVVPGRPLSHLRAYVKREGDIPLVRKVLTAAYPTVPTLFVKADVCREELLVEIEGVLVSRSGNGQEVR
jgi:enamine deaminase RidA (YjgF/YER057c/UK114 family)